jgi:hypothetical protein
VKGLSALFGQVSVPMPYPLQLCGKLSKQLAWRNHAPNAKCDENRTNHREIYSIPNPKRFRCLLSLKIVHPNGRHKPCRCLRPAALRPEHGFRSEIFRSLYEFLDN